MDGRKGRQTPTRSVVIPYTQTHGQEAVELYNQSGRTAIEWQELLTFDIMAVDDDGLWIHQKFGYSLPRRNGKNEVVTMREMWGLQHGEKICHTAHRTTTSHAAWERLVRLLTDAGYVELGRKKKGEKPPEKAFRTTKQYGLESIEVMGGGSAVFRTRTSSGGLGEGFDLLIIDEAQEYTDDQEAALIYTVTDSSNPQTLFCGTPPTPTSAGTVFTKMRDNALAGDMYATGWAEWAVDEYPKDIRDVELWYETNPSMGYHLDERKIKAEITDKSKELDFIIQRLGYWFRYNLKSVISRAEWEELMVKPLPDLTGKLFAGIKYGKDGTNAALSIAVRTADGRVFVESIDCRPLRAGNGWIIDFLRAADVKTVVIDGANGQAILAEEMKAAGLKKPVIPTVKEIITANAAFEKGLFAKTICHAGQESLTQSVSNCEKRTIGTGGGFGYKSIRATVDIALMDSVILAHWACTEDKGTKKQKISY